MALWIFWNNDPVSEPQDGKLTPALSQMVVHFWMWWEGLCSPQTSHKPATVLIPLIYFFCWQNRTRGQYVLCCFYYYDHQLLYYSFSLLILNKKVTIICNTAHVISFFFFLSMHGNCWANHFSLCLSPPSPSLCFDPGWEWSQWAESTDAFSQCHCGKLPLNRTEWQPVR